MQRRSFLGFPAALPFVRHVKPLVVLNGNSRLPKIPVETEPLGRLGQMTVIIETVDPNSRDVMKATAYAFENGKIIPSPFHYTGHA